MQKINFSLQPRSRVKADGTSMVYLILRIEGVRKDLATGQHVPLKNWDHRSKSLKAGKGLSKLEALEKMQILETLLERCRDIQKQAVLQGEMLSHESFKLKLKTSNTGFELIQFTEDYINENPLNWSKATVHSYQGLVSLLKENYGQAVTAADVPQLRNRMEKFLAKKGSSLNTRKKRHKQLKSMLARARKAGFSLPDPYTESIGEVKGHRNFLNVEELNLAIDTYNAGDLPPNLERTLGQFLFSCFTGARYSDMVELTHKNIVGNILEYVAQKTRRFNKVVQAPLPDVGRVLILSHKGKLFDVKTDQTTNRHLKRIFRRIGIRKHITFHCARHTFATLYIYLGGDITNLQELMAHEDISTTMIYVKMAKRLEAHEQKIFDEAFAQRMRVITSGRATWQVV